MDLFVAEQVQKKLKAQAEEERRLREIDNSKIKDFSLFGHHEAPSAVFAAGRSESAVVWWKDPVALREEDIHSYEIHRYRLDDRGDWLHKGYTVAPKQKKKVFIVDGLANDQLYRCVDTSNTPAIFRLSLICSVILVDLR